MTTIAKDPDRLYHLLPALYRIADAQKQGELRALLGLVTRQADEVRDNTQQLWDDFFIETCQRWVIPYIGEIVGNRLLHDLDLASAAATAQSRFTDLVGPDLKPPGAIRLRADVAKTIYYRRRKGTPRMLEQLARDVTGWGAHVVEFFMRLDWNQHLEHLRLDCHGCPDLRRVDVGDRVGGPWDTTTRTVDVRQINEWDGWYNIPNIGFFLWRLAAYRLTQVTPRPIGGIPWRLTFSPLGQDIPLFSSGSREPDDSMASELTVQAPIRAAAFFVPPQHPIDPLHPIPPPSADYYGEAQSFVAFEAAIPLPVAIPLAEVQCQNLEHWGTMTQPVGRTLWIDVTRGRLVVGNGYTAPITLSYNYGFSAPMGGGEYERDKWRLRTAPTIAPVKGGGANLNAVIPAAASATDVIIEIADSGSYLVTKNIPVGPGRSFTIQARNHCRPHIRFAGGQIAIVGGGTVNNVGSSVTFSGLLIEGGLRVNADLDKLRLLHTTLVPGRSVLQDDPSPPTGASLVVNPGPSTGPSINTRLEVEIAFSIVGALRMPAHVTKLWLLDSIVDGILRNGGPFVAAVSDAANTDGPPAHIERCTLFGTSRFHKLDMASESIFTDRVTVEQRQEGCVRFSYVPKGSQTPQQYRCQPALETALQAEKKKAAAAKAGIPLPFGWDAALAAEVASWLVPTFETDGYGRPEFAQLRHTCPVQIRTGAEDGSEMGAFCTLKQPQRESNLRIRLDEYLPVGLQPGVLYVT